jgi:predicted ferric reductase
MQTNRISRFFLAALGLLTAAWLLADSLWPQPLNYFAFRNVFIQYSGVMAMGVMSLAMLLALRPQWLEPHLAGLDKMYRLHKWLGISALVASVLHWWFAQGTKWMVGWGWLTRPQRGPRPAPLNAVDALLGSQHRLAEDVGQWAFYAAALLMVLALVKYFPYRWFAKTHTVLAALYLGLVFHAVVLLKFAYWAQPVGWLMAGLMLVGSYAAVKVLAGRVGAQRKVRGQVLHTTHYPAVESLETVVQLQEGWPGHAAGQFAFVTFGSGGLAQEGAHPYTIASAWNGQTRQLRFITKALGDYTQRLPALLQAGTPVVVEGPYGQFNFEDGRPRQIWVGAGIGITPFVARMQQLAASGARGLQIDLFHPTAAKDEAAIAKLRAAAQAAGIQLHVLVDAQDGRLSGERLRQAVPAWAQASVWFCGPAAFGRALLADMAASGLPRTAWHQELFEMR